MNTDTTTVETPRLRPLRLNRKDAEIFDCFRNRPKLTAQEISILAKRNLRGVQYAVVRLVNHGLLGRQRVSRFDPWIYYVTTKGVRKAQQRNFPHDGIRVGYESSIKSISHEVEIGYLNTQLEAKAAENGFGEPYIERQKRYLAYSFEHDGERISVNPDDFFGLPKKDAGKGRFYMVEVEKSGYHSYDDAGEPDRVRKSHRYAAYQEGRHYADHWKPYGLEVRGVTVLWILRTRERAKRWAKRLRLLHPRETFWVTSEEQVRENVYGEIWVRASDVNISDFEATPRVSFKDA